MSIGVVFSEVGRNKLSLEALIIFTQIIQSVKI